VNSSTLAEIDAAYLAALVDRDASFRVNVERKSGGVRLLRLQVTVYFKREVTGALYLLCGDDGSYGGSFRSLKRVGSVRFRNGEANKMLVAVWPYLKNDTRRRQAQECFRFHKTQYGRGNTGVSLDDELKSIRLDVRRKLLQLAGRA